MDLFNLFAKISIDLSDYEKGLDKAQQEAKTFASNLKSISTNIEKGYSGLGNLLEPAVDGFKAVEGIGKKAGSVVTTGLKGFTVASAAVGGFGAAAVKSGMQFDATMSQVSAISGATGAEFEALRDKALEMGAKTKFSASEAGEAMTYMAMAGWKAEDMIGGISGIMNLAAASGEDLATTSDIVTDALTAFGKSASDSGHLADIMAAASSNANTNVSMLGESFKYVAPVAGALGYTMEDTSLALGLMANSGIKASQAGTSLRTAMTNMASPTKNMAAVMDTYGISLTNADGSMMSLQEVMIQLREKMGGLDEATQASAASMLFGKEAMSGMLAIINAAPEDFDKLTNAIYDCNGAAEEMAATMVDNLQGDLILLGSAFESLQIAISDSLTPTLREFAQFGQKAMANLLEGFQGGGVSGFMSALSNIVTEGVTMLAGKAPEFAGVSIRFVAALAEGILGAQDQILQAGGEIITGLIEWLEDWPLEHESEILSFGTGLVEMIFSGFTKAGEAISTYIGDFIPLIADAFLSYHEALFTVGIDILGAIGQGIIENQDQIQSMASETITNMVTSLRDNAPMIIEGGLALLEALVGAIMENMPLILETGAEIIGRLVEGISTASPELQAIIAIAVLPKILEIVSAVGGIGHAFTEIIPAVKLAGTAISGLFALLAANPIGLVIAAIAALVAAFVALWNNCEGFRNFWIGLWDGLKSVVSKAGAAIADGMKQSWENTKKAWSMAKEFFSGLWDNVKNVTSKAATAIADGMKKSWENTKNAWNTAKSFFSDIWGNVKEGASAAATAIGDGMKKSWENTKNAWGAAKGFFSGVWDNVKASSSKAGTAISDGMKKSWENTKNAWNAATGFFSGLAEKISGVFSGLVDKFKSIGGNIVNGLRNGISNAWSSFVGWLSDQVGGLVNAVKNMLGIHSPSKVFAGIGENMALGLAEGWEDQYRDIKRSIEGGLNFGTTTVGIRTSGGSTYGAQGPQNQPVSRGGDTFIFNSPKALDPVSAAREMKKAKQQMALAFA